MNGKYTMTDGGEEQNIGENWRINPIKNIKK
jgi:hypothetical protein